MVHRYFNNSFINIDDIKDVDNYEFAQSTEDGTERYQRYINNIPTTEFYNIKDGNIIKRSDVSFDNDTIIYDEDYIYEKIEEFKMKNNYNETMSEISHDNDMYFKLDEKTLKDSFIIAKFKNKVIPLLLIEAEYTSLESEIRKLESRAFNLETGEEISLLDLALENM